MVPNDVELNNDRMELEDGVDIGCRMILVPIMIGWSDIGTKRCRIK